jgi:hypothetical protein
MQMLGCCESSMSHVPCVQRERVEDEKVKSFMFYSEGKTPVRQSRR